MRRRCGRMAPGSRLRDVVAARAGCVPAVGSISRSTVLPSVDLPQPDSPTRPSVSPWRDREADAVDRPAPRRRARCSKPPRTGKCLTRSSTSSTGSLMRAAIRHALRPPSRRRCGRPPASTQRRRLGAAALGRAARSAARRRSRRSARVSDGTMPGISSRRGRVPPRRRRVEPRDRRQQAARVGMQRARRTAPRPAPPRPCGRHTSRRRAAAVSATTPRSWVISMIAVPVLLLAAPASGRGSAPGW